MSEDGATTRASVPAGWYDDPHSPAQRRYWDGHDWTTHVAPGATIDLREDRPPPAPPIRRIAARAIDHTVLQLGGPLYILLVLGGDLVGVARVIALVSAMVGLVVLDTVFVGRLGGTPGKLLLGLTVVDATTGQPPSYGRAFRRAILGIFADPLRIGASGFRVASAALPIVWVLIAVVSFIMLFVGDSRTVHDRVGGTRVIEKQHATRSTAN